MSGNQPYNDKELFRLIAEGHEEAFAICVHRFTPFLAPYIKNIVKSEFWVDDLLQNLYTRLWEKREMLAAVENPGGYLNRMASNMALNFLKRNMVEVKAQYRIARESEPNVQEADGRSFDAALYAGLLGKAIEQLTPRQQHIYRLRYEEELSYEEIAEKMSISKNTVRNHLVAAMERVRQYMKEHGGISMLVYFLLKNF